MVILWQLRCFSSRVYRRRARWIRLNLPSQLCVCGHREGLWIACTGQTLLGAVACSRHTSAGHSGGMVRQFIHISVNDL